MHPKRKRKLLTVLMIIIGVAVAATLILTALRKNIDLYYTPKQLLAAPPLAANNHLRLGGLVKRGSIVESKQSLRINFVVTDYVSDIVVVYQGVLPALFREGKGVIVEGRLEGSQFIATRVLAKHDENYRPPNIRVRSE